MISPLVRLLWRIGKGFAYGMGIAPLEEEVSPPSRKAPESEASNVIGESIAPPIGREDTFSWG